ncbi:MAG: DUF4097 family beta strand repeat-containing protein [Erysipelotrichaceae bacterium]
MKNNKLKNILVLTMIVGLIVCIIGCVLNDFKPVSLTNRTEHKYVAAAEVKNIIINDDADIIIRASNDDKLHVTYTDSRRITYAINESNSNLNIDSERTTFLPFISLFNSPTKLIVEVPSTFNGNINSNSKNGYFYLDNITVNCLDVQHYNGHIEIDKLNSLATAKIESKNGYIKINNTIFSDSLDIDGYNGRTELSNSTITNASKINSKNGSIKLNSVKLSNSLTTTTLNGSINASIIADQNDYTFNASSYNGKVNVPNSSSNSKYNFTAETKNGDININFTNNKGDQ